VDVRSLVGLLVELGDRAGAVCRDVHARADMGVVDKGGEVTVDGTYQADSQTAADREVEAMCLAALALEFPGVAVVAEESAGGACGDECDAAAAAGGGNPEPLPRGDEAARAEQAPWPAALSSVEASRVVVYIDPLDGTGEFVAGNLWAVTNLLGVAVDGVPVAGVVNQPWGGAGAGAGGGTPRTVWGGPGAGVHGAAVGGLAEERAVCTNRVLRDERIEPVLAELGLGEPSRVSATGYNLLGVLEGRFGCLVVTRAGTKKWDGCGGEALLAAAGGALADAAGRRYAYSADPATFHNKCGLLASLDAAKVEGCAAAVRRVCDPWPLDVDDPSVVAPAAAAAGAL